MGVGDGGWMQFSGSSRGRREAQNASVKRVSVKSGTCLIGRRLFQKAGLQETDCWLIFLNQVKLGSRLLNRAGERFV